ncbi:alkaline phosphatase D family protein [Ekhidna sp.]|uniref:alkaline phosphatase D family protein n=1 Tax=Ekhidna sp. TaxID=2608089 RepID=UPI003CCB78EA
MKYLIILFLGLPSLVLGQQADVVVAKNISQVAFGSCSKQDQPDKQLWKEINHMEPDLWIWLGDNIYGDTDDMRVMRSKYDKQKSHKGYQQLLENTEVLGIWDDHDYGGNDGGKEYPKKDESKEELFRFLDIADDHPGRGRKGAYQSYVFESNKRIKVILLDTRYFRDSLKWNWPSPGKKEAIINPTGEILGEEQWKWFEQQLSEPDIDLFIICSGIQIIPKEHVFEKWANFPRDRERFLKTITPVESPLILLSGDRHMSEVSRIELDNRKHPIYEFTSSSLTSPWGMERDEPNQFREKNIIYKPNFAHLDISWSGNILNLELNYFGKGSEVLQTHLMRYSE